ncbi:DUF4176 domain-containing protein [Streptococcus sp. H31]|uniref:DUF4176 domain-containing protein n=1 Tax=Streptococcus huangxiaojuni TaxID=3237239 RepID=UPI0034A27F13
MPITSKNGKEGYFDFGAVPLSLGVISQELAFFNREDIEEILFLGYIAASFQQISTNYDDLIEQIDYPKFTVEEYNKS